MVYRRVDYAILLVVTAGIAVGVVSSVVRTWALHRRVYSLEDRMGVLEGVQTREVKIRAAQARAPNSQADHALYNQLSSAPPMKKKNWWETVPKT